jgi:hypothetical protein
VSDDVYCRYEKARYPSTAFVVQDGVRIHRGTDPLHSVTGRLVSGGGPFPGPDFPAPDFEPDGGPDPS